MPLVTARDGSSVRKGADPPSSCSSGCHRSLAVAAQIGRYLSCLRTSACPRLPVWFLAGPVGHLGADRWQSASYRVPAVPRGTDAGRRSAARPGRLPGFSSSAPEETLWVGQSLLDRHELAGRVSLNIKQWQPDTAPSRGNGMRASSRRTRTCPRFASSVTSAATRSTRAAQAQRLIADGASCFSTVLLQPDQELRDHRRKPQMESCLPRCQPSPTHHRKLALAGEQAQAAPDADRRPSPDPESQ